MSDISVFVIKRSDGRYLTPHYRVKKYAADEAWTEDIAFAHRIQGKAESAKESAKVKEGHCRLYGVDAEMEELPTN
jgi:hypothetical protein